MKRVISMTIVLALLVAFCACGCSGDKGAKLEESELTGAQVQEEFWKTDLDESAALLNGYRAQSAEEVTRNWRQAKMQGNGAILYALYSDDLKELFLNRMKNEFGIWNFYYGRDYEKPQDVTCSQVQEMEGEDGKYYSTITTIESDGMTRNTYDIYIKLVDGGYFVISETAPVPVE